MLTRSTIHKIVLPLVVLAVLFTYSNVFSSQETAATETVKKFSITARDVNISALAYAVFDVESGEILLAENEKQVLPIASVTKLFTTAALLESYDLTKVGTITNKDVDTYGQAGRLVAGNKYRYHELLFPLLLESSNDAAAFFERETKGQVIVTMNELAKKIGAQDTVLFDASGLSDNNVSTVSDLVTFLGYLSREQKHVLDITRLRQYVGPYSGLLNNNPIIDKDFLGGKHGYTIAANRTLVALFNEEFGTTSRGVGYILLSSNNLVSDVTILRDFVTNSVTFE